MELLTFSKISLKSCNKDRPEISEPLTFLQKMNTHKHSIYRFVAREGNRLNFDVRAALFGKIRS